MRRAGRILRAGCEHHPRGGHCLLLFRRNRPCRVYRGGVSDSRAGPGINGSGASRTAAGADKRSAPACFPKKGISQPAAAKADKQPPAFPCKQGTNEARLSTKKAERRNYAGAAVENIKEAVFCGKIGDFYPDMERAPTTADFCLVYRTAACSAEKAFNSDALWIKPSEYRRKTDLQGKLSPSRETRNAPFSALTMHRRHHDNKSIICNIPCPQKEAVCRLRSKADDKKGEGSAPKSRAFALLCANRRFTKSAFRADRRSARRTSSVPARSGCARAAARTYKSAWQPACRPIPFRRPKGCSAALRHSGFSD